jgi:uncharacterized Rmd1/YagE family protein
VFDRNKSNVLHDLTRIYGQELWVIGNNCVAVPYDYEEKDYKFLLNKIALLKMEQLIVTSSMFIRLLEYTINQKFHINELEFLESISDEDKEFYKEQLNILNLEKNGEKRKMVIKTFLPELQWLIVDGCIDIKSIDLSYIRKTKQNENDKYESVQIFNNGVVLSNNNQSEDMDKIVKVLVGI